MSLAWCSVLYCTVLECISAVCKKEVWLYFFPSLMGKEGVSHAHCCEADLICVWRIQKLIITTLESLCQYRDCEKPKNHWHVPAPGILPNYCTCGPYPCQCISECPLKSAIIKFLTVVFVCGITYYAIHVCLCLCAGQRMQLEQWRRGWMATGITGKWCWLWRWVKSRMATTICLPRSVFVSPFSSHIMLSHVKQITCGHLDCITSFAFRTERAENLQSKISCPVCAWLLTGFDSEFAKCFFLSASARSWRRAWRTAAIAFTRWSLAGTLSMACLLKSSPLKTTRLQLFKIKC